MNTEKQIQFLKEYITECKEVIKKIDDYEGVNYTLPSYFDHIIDCLALGAIYKYYNVGHAYKIHCKSMYDQDYVFFKNTDCITTDSFSAVLNLIPLNYQLFSIEVEYNIHYVIKFTSSDNKKSVHHTEISSLNFALIKAALELVITEKENEIKCLSPKLPQIKYENWP